ncbi:Probable sentrin-specific protease 8 (Deneddylase) (Sentrin/sumo-specific protease senp8) [Durusdinium trenchii]|uniref:Probable sentrin-specific protease 8 (Deneddylase) (Sentrin/sumo-specific protease senp8) n=1 Tax=Durusdinium trenchii TaxID=1381693 RepID=A0ABP0LMD9_9DINO
MALVSWKSARITAAGLGLLEPGRWLDDEVMNFWIQYYTTTDPPDGLGDREDVLIMDPSVVSWILYELTSCKEPDLEDVQDALESCDFHKKQRVLIPLSDRQDKGGDGYKGVHWALLALERHGEEVQGHYYDSMGSGNLHQAQLLASKLCSARVSVAPAGKQQNACDCGVFTLLFAEALSRGENPKDITQAQADEARNRMASKIRSLARPS